MLTKKPALYSDIWKILKEKGKCKIAAHPSLHKRIIHAVVNKKYYDAGFTLELNETHRHCKIQYIRGANFITFALVYHINKNTLKELTVEEL